MACGVCGLDIRRDKLRAHFSKHGDLHQVDAFALHEGEEPLDPVHVDWVTYLLLKGMDARPKKKRKTEEGGDLPKHVAVTQNDEDVAVVEAKKLPLPPPVET